MRLSIARCGVASAMVIACSLLPRPGLAQSGAAPVGTTTQNTGAATFRLYCAVCHGEKGKGNGPASSALHPRPSNLTTLTGRKGSFPAERVTRTIKGVDSVVVAHGIEGMMVWNAFFLADANGDEGKAEQRVKNLVEYIESIQVR